MGINLEILKEAAAQAASGMGEKVIEHVPKAVSDWRNTNTERARDAYHHTETMYELRNKRILGYMDMGISAVNALGSLMNGATSLNSSRAAVYTALESRDRVQMEIQAGERAHQRALLDSEQTHRENMEKLSIERERIARELENAETESARQHEDLRRIIDKFTETYDRCLAMDDDKFLSDNNIKAMRNLHESILGLTHELLSTESPLSK